jgi:hypothetical protein
MSRVRDSEPESDDENRPPSEPEERPPLARDAPLRAVRDALLARRDAALRAPPDEPLRDEPLRDEPLADEPLPEPELLPEPERAELRRELEPALDARAPELRLAVLRFAALPVPEPPELPELRFRAVPDELPAELLRPDELLRLDELFFAAREPDARPDDFDADDALGSELLPVPRSCESVELSAPLLEDRWPDVRRPVFCSPSTAISPPTTDIGIPISVVRGTTSIRQDLGFALPPDCRLYTRIAELPVRLRTALG